MNFKRILVLVLVLTMIVSACAPAISAAAGSIEHDHDYSTEAEAKKEINYVSLGDSMTNGLALDGYDSKKQNGFLELAADSYPAKVAAWLAGLEDSRDYGVGASKYIFNGPDAKVSLTQLATSAARAEDILYILQADPNLLASLPDSAFNYPYNLETFGIGTNGYTGDFWTIHELLDNGSRWGNEPEGFTKGEWAAYVAATFQSSVRDADVITLAAGNSNFGVYLMHRLMNIVGFSSEQDLANDREYFAYMTFDNAVKLIEESVELGELKDEASKLVHKVYDRVMAELFAMGLPEAMMTEICDRFTYTTASYLVSYTDLIVRINELNPDAEVVIVPLINNANDFNLEVVYGGRTISLNVGKLLSLLYTPLNAYLAGIPAAMQLQEGYQEGTYYYAELPVKENGQKVQVETFAQAFGDLYAPVVAGEAYPESRLFCHSRFIEDVRGFVFPILMGEEGVWFNEVDVMQYEIAYSNGALAFASYLSENSEKAQWIAYYLGVVDAVMTSMGSSSKVDVDSLMGAGGGLMGVIGSQTADIAEKIMNGITIKATETVPAIVNDIFDAFVFPVLNNDILPQIKQGYVDAYAQYGIELTDEMFNEMLANGEIPEWVEAMEMGMAQAVEVATGVATVMHLPEVFSNELTSVGLLSALLNVYGHLKMANGIAAHPSAAGHDTLAESIINAIKTDYTVQDETIENIEKAVTIIGGLVVEYYDEAYAYGYAYADAHGYTNKVVSAIDRVINRIERVDLSDNKMTDGFEKDLQRELDATVATLEEIKQVILTDSAKDVPGALAAARALKDDLKTHIKNIYYLCEQLAIDVNNILIIPALQEIAYYIETEVIPAVCDYIDAIVNRALAHIEARFNQILPELEYVYGITRDVVLQIARQLFLVWSGVEDAIEIAKQVIDTLVIIFTELGLVIEDAIVIAHQIFNVLVDVFGGVRNALEVTFKVMFRIYHYIIKYGYDVKALAEFLYDVYQDITAIIVETYGETQDALYTAEQVHKYLVNLLLSVNEDIMDAIHDSSNAEFQLREENFYVALGNATYVEELAEMLLLGDRYAQFGLYDDYADAVAMADLITIKFNNGEFYEFAYTQIMGTVANIVRSNSDLMGWCNNPWIGESVRAEIAALGIDLEAECIELDWSKYFDDEEIAVLKALLAELRAHIIAEGVIEQVEIDLTPEIESLLIENNLAMEGVTIELDPLVIPVADLLVYAVENMLYSYALFVERTAILLADVRALAPEAIIVITAVTNPLDLLPAEIVAFVPDFDTYSDVLDLPIATLNAYLHGLALVHEDTIYVNSEDPADIYRSLNVYCLHKYDDECLDTTCNICGEVRPQPGHNFVNYKSNNDATCTEDGTKTGTCSKCGITDTQTDKGTAKGHKLTDATCTAAPKCTVCGQSVGKALGHSWNSATCTEPKTCKVCGVTQGTPNGHRYGEWETIQAATRKEDGLKKHTCLVCGHVETEIIPKPVVDEPSIGQIIALALGSIIVAFSASTAIIILIQRKREQ